MDLNGVTRRYLSNFKARSQAVANVGDCLPVKIRASHCFVGHYHSWWHNIFGAISSIISLSTKRRFIVHAGTAEENLDALGRKFGIRPDNLPADIGGTVGPEYFVHWLEDRKAAGL